MIVLDYEQASGLALVATGKIACGQIEVRHVPMPQPPIRPPASLEVLKAPNGGMAVVGAKPLAEEELVLEHWDEAIEGEIKRGRLKGVVCDRKVEIRVATKYEGPVLALVPVSRIGKPPKFAFRLLAYKPVLP
ncbi:MAG: hypothetical protein QXP98_07645 [Thermoproteus sp.]